jgi:hypothetical protein
MREAPDAIVYSSRVFQYDPVERFRGDPMAYGAYRRWKSPESDTSTSTKGNSKNNQKKNSNGSSNDKKKKSKNGGITTDSFYNAIKKLGSGPVEKVYY